MDLRFSTAPSKTYSGLAYAPAAITPMPHAPVLGSRRSIGYIHRSTVSSPPFFQSLLRESSSEDDDCHLGPDETSQLHTEKAFVEIEILAETAPILQVLVRVI